MEKEVNGTLSAGSGVSGGIDFKVLLLIVFLKVKVYYLGQFKGRVQRVKPPCFGLHLGMESVLNWST